MDVALIRGGNVQRERAEQRVARGLEDRGAVGHVEPEAAVLDGPVRGEDARLASERLESGAGGLTAGCVDVAVERVVDRQYLRRDEVSDGLDERFGHAGLPAYS